MATGFLPDDEKKKKNSFGDAAAASVDASVQRIPTGGLAAPAPDGRGDNTELSRNVNNGLNALGGMGVVSSVPLGFQAAGNVPRLTSNALPVLPGANAALQEGAQANALAGAARSLGNASAGLTAADSAQRRPALAPTPQQGVTGTWQDQLPQQGVTGTWPAAAPKGAGLYPYNMPGKDIYAGAGKPSSAPENTPLPGSITGGAVPRVAAAAPAAAQAMAAPAAPVPPPAAPVPPLDAPVPPLDAQAAADRATASGFIGGFKDVNQRAGAAIADVATLVPRGLAGAYDTAVVRPMRAAGINAGYMSPLLAPNGADPASQTPFYDKIRQQDAARAAAAPAIPAGNSTAGAGRGTAPDPRATNAPAFPNASVVPNPLQADPAAPASPATPANNITREGNSYSGNNITDGFTINGQQPRNGGAISAQNQSAAQAMSDRYQAEAARGFTPGTQAGSELTAAQRAGNFTPTGGDTGGFGLLDRSVREKRNADVTMSSITANKEQKQVAAAEYAAINARDAQAASEAGNMTRFGMQDATARRGQDAAFSTSQATNALAQQRLGLEGQELGIKQTAAGFTARAAARIESLQAAFDAAKPEDRPAIAEQLRVLTGKDKPAQWDGVAIAGSKNTDGSTNEGDVALYNKQTGETKRAGQPGAQPALPPGMKKQVGTFNGRPVYEDANGKQVMAKV